jgi:hypothetical protein
MDKQLGDRELANKFLGLVERLDLDPYNVSTAIMMELRNPKNLSKDMAEIEDLAGEVASLWIPEDEQNREKAKKLFIEMSYKLSKIASSP